MKCRWRHGDYIAFATLVVYIVGAIIAYRALHVYENQSEELKKQSQIQINMSLRSAENALYEMPSKDEFLMAFFADPPDKEDFTLADAQNYVNLFLEHNKLDGWKNVQELVSIIYEPSKNYHNPDRKKLRKAFDLAERLLYLLQDANSAYRAKILTKAEYETWISYVDDLGFNPLFLSALCFGHSSGYITEVFAQEIKDRIMRSKLNKQAASVVYKELLQDDWLKKVGKREYDDILTTKPIHAINSKGSMAVIRNHRTIG